MLVGKNQLTGNFLAAMIGSITPFCSCSAVPLFIAMTQARIPLSSTFTYLIASPMINEVAFILLWATVGWQVALTYYITGLIFALIGGYVIGRLKMEKHVEPWVYEDHVSSAGCSGNAIGSGWSERLSFARAESISMIKKVGLYVLIGIGIGAAIHGYVPESALSTVMGTAWWAVPVSVLIALPLYDNAGGVIPVVQALLAKGAALGTVLSFMMGITAMSLPELLILKKVMRLPLIATFVGVVGIGILIIGYFFNYLFSLGIIHIALR
ncbi:permease [Dongshaea marina]|uniref:permease n=1 Tax=Dongshaea marina TaxID=2047966 RepID=UPI001901BAAD|nr:permease [Dongshaea marina]